MQATAHSRRMVLGATLSLTALCTALAAPLATAAERRPLPRHAPDVKLERTSHGVVHVTARNYRDLGFGVAYAYTEDNRCLLAHRIAQVNGRLSAQLGPSAIVTISDGTHYMPSLTMDAFYRSYYDLAAIRAGFDAGAPDVRELAAGYADGVNAFRADHPALPACTPVDFTAPVSVDDVYRMWVATAGLASGEFAAPFLAITEFSLAPSAPAALTSPAPATLGPPAGNGIGSNAWALGRDATRGGARALHLYNPHFPWAGIQRLYIVHARIPGELDVMGPVLGGFPLPASGFTESIAWGITFSTAARFTLMEVEPLASNPLKYLVDGQEHDITPQIVPIEVAHEATPRPVVVYTTADGPIVPAAVLGLPNNNALILRDVNRDNTRVVEQWLAVAKARSVHEVRDRLAAIQGVPWSYTIASDAKGGTFFGDLSAVPKVTAALDQQCQSPSSALLRFLGVFALDGSRSACRWEGRLPSDQLPAVTRTDYVANGNNTYELPNLDSRLVGSSPILGEAGQGLALRPALALRTIAQRLDGSDGRGAPGFTAPLLEAIFADHRHLGGELLVDEVVALCRQVPVVDPGTGPVDLTAVCDALAAWDRHTELDSRGAHVFHGLWLALRELGATPFLFATPASLDAPLTTPAGLSPDPTVRGAVLGSLARVASALQAAGVAPDARWGDVHFAVGANGAHFGLPGGSGTEGIFDSIDDVTAFTFAGWVQSLHGSQPAQLYGSSYSHIVKHGRGGLEARARLAYSQATEPTSPWYQDELGVYSGSELFPMPFSSKEIRDDLQSSKIWK